MLGQLSDLDPSVLLKKQCCSLKGKAGHELRLLVRVLSLCSLLGGARVFLFTSAPCRFGRYLLNSSFGAQLLGNCNCC